MNSINNQHRAQLQRIARRVMAERGLLPDFSAEALQQLARIQAPARDPGRQVRDLTDILWASIDNDDSRDLDQLTYAEAMAGGKTKILVAVADVDSLVKDGSAIDQHAHHNTTSVYTPAEIFPMLPQNLSTNLTSLNVNENRLAIVIEMVIDTDGSQLDSTVYRALVRNRAQLAYDGVAAWLDGTGPEPVAIAAIKGLGENLRLQDRIAQRLKDLRHTHGALSVETIETQPIFDGDTIQKLVVMKKNRADSIIEDFMIAANGTTARFLSSKQFPSLRRVVRTPRRWERIVEIADERKFSLPSVPDAKALNKFLMREKTEEPLTFPDLSLAIIKLMGPGEYVAELSGDPAPGHFGLAVKDYTHSTAPNRRYPDLITQRLLKAAIEGDPIPYSNTDLENLAQHCTEKEDAANKVERQVTKSAAALLLQSRIGEQFDAIVTGSGPKGTWVRLLFPPVEGKLIQTSGAIDVGHKIRVRLNHVDVERGFIDFIEA